MDRAERRRQIELRTCYRDAWGILTAWAQCACDFGSCPLEQEMHRLGFTPGDLLEAAVTGNPAVIGISTAGRP